MKKFLIVVAALISILGMGSLGWAYTLTVTNDMGDLGFNDCGRYKFEFMAEVNFYYNAIENVKAQTAYIASGGSFTYDSGKWCPSGVTGIMHIKQINKDGSPTKQWKYIILAADNWGNHGTGLRAACQSSTFKIKRPQNACNRWEFGDNTTFTFERQ